MQSSATAASNGCVQNGAQSTSNGAAENGHQDQTANGLTLNKTTQEIVRLIGQYLKNEGLTWVDLIAFINEIFLVQKHFASLTKAPVTELCAFHVNTVCKQNFINKDPFYAFLHRHALLFINTHLLDDFRWYFLSNMRNVLQTNLRIPNAWVRMSSGPSGCCEIPPARHGRRLDEGGPRLAGTATASGRE